MAEREKITADVAVIGGGSGGLVVAAVAAPLGLKTVLFERGKMGGDCLNYGCVPSKALIAAGKAAQNMRESARFGVASVEPQVEWLQVRAHVRGVIAGIEPHDSQERFEGLGVRVIREHARFRDADHLVSDSVEVKARYIVVATGSGPAVPPIPGIDQVPFLTNETVFDLPVLPKKLIVLGAGPIGIELGQAFGRLGSRVTVVEAARALGAAEPEMAAVVVEKLRKEGVELLEGFRATRVERTELGEVRVTIEGPDRIARSVEGTHLLVSVGRRPHVQGMDLEKAGVEFDSRGIKTTPYMRTTNKRVWAVGDVAGRGQFTHVAGFQAGLFIRNALFKLSQGRADAMAIPGVTYCEPELAQIGLTEAEARQIHGDAVRVTSWTFHENDRARAERSEEGLGKIVADKKGRILGASVVGDHAGELIAPIALCMGQKLTYDALRTSYIAPYPTRGELVQRLAKQFSAARLYADSTRRLVSMVGKILP